MMLQEISCSTAEEFLGKLSPIGEYFMDEPLNSPWLFRGQGQDYKLIPALFRTDKASKKKLKSLGAGDVSNYKKLRRFETDTLIDFFFIADRRGLILPDDSQELRSFLDSLRDNANMVEKGYEGWRIETKGLSLIALAQHYGIPTRLLDWTRQSYISAFFAAEGAKKFIAKDNTSKLVVWAFYFPALGKQTAYGESYLLRSITAPSATNLNLKAQQGVFTMTNLFYSKEATGNYLPLDEMLKNLARTSDPAHSDIGKLVVTCELLKFTLPVSEAPRLLYLLAKLDITPSAIYTGYHSIISDLQMKNSWGDAK